MNVRKLFFLPIAFSHLFCQAQVKGPERLYTPKQNEKTHASLVRGCATQHNSVSGEKLNNKFVIKTPKKFEDTEKFDLKGKFN